MNFGYILPNSWGVPDLGAIGDLAVHAEDVGADALWVSHHVLHVGFVGERLGTLPYHDPLVTLTVVATRTTRPTLGVSVLVAPYVHVVSTAKTLATIDLLSGGRVVVGVGAGGLRAEHDAVGLTPWNRRGRYTDEFIDVLRLLWTPGPGSFSGEFHSLVDVEAYPGPVNGQIPILVGGNSTAALKRAATKGDGWHGTGLDVEHLVTSVGTLRQLLADGGRAGSQFPMQLRLHVDVADADPAAWADRAAAFAEIGVTHLALAPQSGDVAMHSAWLDVVPAAILGVG
jgi:probable F420-dependent oxidoreductase